MKNAASNQGWKKSGKCRWFNKALCTSARETLACSARLLVSVYEHRRYPCYPYPRSITRSGATSIPAVSFGMPRTNLQGVATERRQHFVVPASLATPTPHVENFRATSTATSDAAHSVCTPDVSRQSPYQSPVTRPPHRHAVVRLVRARQERRLALHVRPQKRGSRHHRFVQMTRRVADLVGPAPGVADGRVARFTNRR